MANALSRLSKKLAILWCVAYELHVTLLFGCSWTKESRAGCRAASLAPRELLASHAPCESYSAVVYNLKHPPRTTCPPHAKVSSEVAFNSAMALHDLLCLILSQLAFSDHTLVYFLAIKL